MVKWYKDNVVFTLPLILALFLTPVVRFQRHIPLLSPQRPFILFFERHNALLGQPYSGIPAQRPAQRHISFLGQPCKDLPAPRHMVLCTEWWCTFFHSQSRWYTFPQAEGYTDRPRSSCTPRCAFGRVNQSETFLSRAAKTSFGCVLEEPMEFDIGVYRWGFNGTCHDCIVVSSTLHGCVTLELCQDPETRSGRIIPMCQQFNESVKDVEWKIRVNCTFKQLAEIAMEVWEKMGSYSLVGNNCQDFCNGFLERTSAPPYMTTRQNAKRGSTGVILTVLLFFKGRKM